jgi:hypothetical protein
VIRFVGWGDLVARLGDIPWDFFKKLLATTDTDLIVTATAPSFISLLNAAHAIF